MIADPANQKVGEKWWENLSDTFSGILCISVILDISDILDVITSTMYISFFVDQKPCGSLSANPLSIHTMVLTYHAP